ncbi:DMT family transporter [Halalkalibacillus halophilus]|uniref:DMT family transporter n=1 Tax=Halalkalibacillus halophilus TaxID=392827 RepID=UPI00041BBBB5|nr:DMT family transporter [Halalkalibacillus halophilus]
MERKSIQWVLILIITIIWGYSWVLMKDALLYMEPFTFSAFRFGLGAIVMVLVVMIYKLGLPPRDKIFHLLVLGMLQTAIVFLLVMYALKFIDAGKSSLLLYSMPLWSGVLANLLLKEKTSKIRWTGLVIGMFGLAIILFSDLLGNVTLEVLFGEFLIVIAAISWAFSNIYYRIFLNKLPRLQVNAYQMLFGAIAISIVAFLAEGDATINWTFDSIYYVVFTGVLASALCFTVWFMLLSVVDTIGATMPSLLVPVFGIFFGWLLLDEIITWNILIGSIFILSGILITNIRSKK